jgi:hypothetical protein
MHFAVFYNLSNPTPNYTKCDHMRQIIEKIKFKDTEKKSMKMVLQVPVISDGVLVFS